MRRPSLALVLATLAAGCAQRAQRALEPLRVAGDTVRVSPACATAPCRDTVDLLYLGVGGFVIRRGAHALMTAPSVSHPGLIPVFFARAVSSNGALVDSLMRRVEERVPLDAVSGILVGHGHYDHLLDVPRTMKWTPNANVYGSATVRNLLTPFPRLDTTRVRVVDDSAGDARRDGRWIYTDDRAFRFMPLRSAHAPNFLWFTIARRSLRAPRRTRPANAHQWLMGPVYAYLIDVLDAGGAPVFRVLYQDAAAERAYESLPAARRADTVDVAIITVGNFKGWPFGVRDYPHALLDSLKPRRVVLGHWENFFRAPTDSLRVIPLTDTRELVRRVEGAVGAGNWVTLRPLAGERYVF